MIEIKISIPADFIPSGNLLTETARYLAAINGMKMVDDETPPAGSEYGEMMKDVQHFDTPAGDLPVDHGHGVGDLQAVDKPPAKQRKKKEVPPPPPAAAPEPVVPEAPQPMNKDIFMSKITAAISERKLTYADVSAACIAVGASNLPEVCGKPELFEELHKILRIE